LDQGKILLFNIFKAGAVAVFGGVAVRFFKTNLLPVMVGCGNFVNIFHGQLRKLFLIRRAHFPQIKKQNFFFAVPVFNYCAIVLYGPGFLFLLRTQIVTLIFVV